MRAMLNDNVILLEADTGYVILSHSEQDQLFRFSGIEASILKLIEENEDVSLVIKKLLAEYEFEGTSIENFIKELLTDLESKSIVKII